MACLKKGCLQLYCGDGKGKTTASVGLAVRAVGDHLSVLSGAFWILLEYVG